MTKTVNIYIGSNNATHKLELFKIKKLCASFFEGFTIQRVNGFYHGHGEDSAIVTVMDESGKIDRAIGALKEALHQESIGYQNAEPLLFA